MEVPLDVQLVKATVRPVVLFVRQQVLDDPLPTGVSKIGGYPDLPANFTWPERPAYPDAERKVAELRRGAERMRTMYEGMMREPRGPHQRQITSEDLDRVTAEYETRCVALSEPMPLAFVAQLDLAFLIREAGFDSELPRTGLLSIFNDTTWDGATGAHWVFWHDQPVAELVRTSPPPRLVAHCEALEALMSPSGDVPWSERIMAERLHPSSRFSVPQHWKSAYPHGTVEADAVYDWLDCQPGFYPSASDVGADGDVMNFGDKLGGWPEDIQGHPEEEITVEGVRAKPITQPGQTPWRHLFSYGNEHHGGTRLMESLFEGDGNTYVFLHEDDLRARRFERAQTVYQQT
nr:DUF1963 domain-containing protein [Methylobacterium sp. GC_Met_2]